MSNSKPFDQSLHDECDPKAREVVKRYYKSMGITMLDNEDKYGVDLISEDGSRQAEVERRLVWRSGDFPFADINMPERKAKFFLNSNASYVVVSEDFTRVGGISNENLRKFIKEDNLKANPNKYVGSGEMFYKLPRHLFTWITVS
jgi:hypothetical protein